MGEITCAFCKGKGKDPFDLLSRLSACQVCGGMGKIKTDEMGERSRLMSRGLNAPFVKAAAFIPIVELPAPRVADKAALHTGDLKRTAPIAEVSVIMQTKTFPAASAKAGELSAKGDEVWLIYQAA